MKSATFKGALALQQWTPGRVGELFGTTPPSRSDTVTSIAVRDMRANVPEAGGTNTAARNQFACIDDVSLSVASNQMP